MEKGKLNVSVVNTEMVAYAKEEAAECKIDCADGCNPYGCCEKVIDALSNFDKKMICEYPHGFDMKDALIASWDEFVKLQRDNIVLTDGAMEAISIVNTLFAADDAKVLGVWPQFTDYVFNAQCQGIEYRPVVLKPEDNYKIPIDELKNIMQTEEISLLYIDNPNNPTGQAYSASVLRGLLDVAKENRIYCIVDEAYGDYLEPENSAMTMVTEYDNLLVIRSCSKGLGLAGMRTGYVVADKELTKLLLKLTSPYNISALGRKLTSVALSDTDFMKANREKISACKKKIKKHIGNKLHMAETLDTCSICLIYHEDQNADLYSMFADADVNTVDGRDFKLGKNCVRLRMPKQEHEEELMKIIDSIDK